MGEKFSQIFSFFLEFSRRGGGCQIGGGCRRHFLYLIFLGEIFFLKFSLFFSFFLKFSRNTFLCIGIPGKFSNFLKFSLFFSNFLEGGGVPDRGGCRRHFLYLTFWGKNYLNFSDFLGMHFLYWRYAGEILPQIFPSCARTFFSLVFFNISNLNFP